MRDEGRLFGGFGQYGVACGQGRADLAGKDGQREIPWADAGECANGRRVGRIGAVVAQEIHGLAQFGNRIHLRFSRLSSEERENFPEIFLVDICRAGQDFAALRAGRIPGFGAGECGVDVVRAGQGHGAGDVCRSGWIGGLHRIVWFCSTCKKRRRRPCRGGEGRAGGLNHIQCGLVMEVKALRVGAFRRKKLCALGQGWRVVGQRFKRVAGDRFGGHIFIDDLIDEARIGAVFQ